MPTISSTANIVFANTTFDVFGTTYDDTYFADVKASTILNVTNGGSSTIGSGGPVILNGNGVYEAANSSPGGNIPQISYDTSNITASTPISNPASGAGTRDYSHISGNKYLYVYRDDLNSFYGTAVIATVDGDNITYGTPTVFESAYMGYAYCVALDSTKAVVMFQAGNQQSGHLWRLSLDTTTDTISTVGIKDSFASGGNVSINAYNPIARVNNDIFVIAYDDNSTANNYESKIMVCELDAGASIIKGTPAAPWPAGTRTFSFDLVEFTGNTGDKSFALVSSVNSGIGIRTFYTSGRTATFYQGSPIQVISSQSAGNITATNLATAVETSALFIAYTNYSNSAAGTAFMVYIATGGNLSTSATQTFSTKATGCSAARISDTEVILTYREEDDAFQQFTWQKATAPSTFGGSITFGDRNYVVRTSYGSMLAGLTDNILIGDYDNTATTGLPELIIIGPEENKDYSIIGLAEYGSNVSSGQDFNLLLEGEITDWTSAGILVPGKKYYYANGSFTTDSSNASYIGIATATNEIIVKG